MLESLERLCPREIFKTQGWTQKEECCGKANQYKKDDEKRAPARQRTYGTTRYKEFLRGTSKDTACGVVSYRIGLE